MKNKFSLAPLIAMGLMTAACTTDTNGANSTSQNKMMESMQKQQMV